MNYVCHGKNKEIKKDTGTKFDLCEISEKQFFCTNGISIVAQLAHPPNLEK